MQFLAIAKFYAQIVGGFIALVVIALWLIPRFARPNIRGATRAWVIVVSCMFLVFALVLPSIGEQARSTAALSRLDNYCLNAGEQIYSTATNVAGVLAYIPFTSATSHALYHEDDFRKNAYARLPWRRYQFFEATSHRPGHEDEVEYFTAGGQEWPPIWRQERSADIAFTWTRLTSIEDQAEGLYGDETIVFSREDRHVFARRKIYYFVSPTTSNQSEKQISLCPGMTLGEDPNYIDRRPRDSYAFVSRVAQPSQLDQEAISKNFDLFPGSGQRTPRSCPYPIRASDDVRKDDVLLLRKNDDLIVELKSKKDSVVCERFFGAGRGAPAPGGNPRVRFSDGFIIYDHDVDRLAVTSK